MKILILSDLHLEFAPFPIKNIDVDVVVLAGDINLPIVKSIQWAKELFYDKPVIYIPGNHEYYNKFYVSMDEIEETGYQESLGTNVFLLSPGEQIIGDVRFLGTTLWTDYALLGRVEESLMIAKESMNDHKLIFISSMNEFLPENALTAHNLQLAWLVEKLDEKFDGKTVIVSHHLPSIKSIPEEFLYLPHNSSYASDLTWVIEKYQPALWIHGHTHGSNNYIIDSTRVISNPKGYPHAMNENFNPELTIEI